MGKTLSLLIGAIVSVVGLILLIAWWYEFMFLIRGIIPLVLVGGGVVAIVAGFSEFKDTLKSKK